MEQEIYKETKLIREDEWLEFREFDQEDYKTRRILVWSKCSNCYLGEIKWVGSWRHYCFVIDMEHIGWIEQLIFSDRCQEAILKFTKELNEEHKKSKLNQENISPPKAKAMGIRNGRII